MESQGRSLVWPHPEENNHTIMLIIVGVYLHSGDCEFILPIVEVGDRPIDGESEAHQGHQGPHQSVHQGQGPVGRQIYLTI